MKRLIAFDLDGTLAESKQPLGEAMGAALAALLAITEVAVMSGGDWPQFEKQVTARLPKHADLTRLWIMPTTGAKLYRFVAGAWQQIYADLFDKGQRDKIVAAIEEAVAKADLKPARIWGEQVEDRGTQLTFSALGQQAPLDAKKAWDSDFAKRKKLQAALRKVLPDLSVNIGGSTSIDVTQKGVDKGYGMRRLAKESGLPLDAMLFVGDALYPGGNDYPAREAGVDAIATRDVAETLTIIAAITTWVGPAGEGAP